MAITVPAEGRPATAPGAEALVGGDGNAFAILGTAKRLLQRAGASPAYITAMMAEATTGDYSHVLATCMAYLDAEGPDAPAGAGDAVEAYRG